jgi:hypothetical protein
MRWELAVAIAAFVLVLILIGVLSYFGWERWEP